MSLRLHLIAAVAVLVACSETTGPLPIVANLSVVQDTLSIEMRDTAQLNAVLKDSAGHIITRVAAQWSSSDTTRATVSATGKVIGVAAGIAWIRASAGGHSDSARVSVLVPVTTFAIAPTTVTLVKGATVLISPFPRDSDGTYLFNRVTWSSSDTTKAVIVSVPCFIGTCGLVTARDSGMVTITAASGRLHAVAQLTQAVVRFASLTVADNHTCALTQAGAAWCWGLNSIGELAVPHYDQPRATPGLVRGNLEFLSLSAGGNHTCGLTSVFTGYCWGNEGEVGALGSVAPTPDTIPTPISGSFTFSALSSGGRFGCGLLLGGAPYCWGSGLAQIGTNDVPNGVSSFSPVPVTGGLTFAALSSGRDASCGLTAGHVAYCWGDNTYGQLGNDSSPPTGTGPVPVTGGLNFAVISSGGSHTCGVTISGEGYCWGQNTSGQLGTADTMPARAPVPVTGGLMLTSISAGHGSTCAIATGGAAYCWGSNNFGQLGVGTTDDLAHTSPMTVTGGLTFTTVATSSAITCGIASTGIAHCWGFNFYGQLGNGSYSHANTPTRVTGQF